MIRPTALFSFLLLGLCGCAGKQAGLSEKKETQIEISYLRGANSHRYLLLEDKEVARVQAFRDQYLMKEREISLERFNRLASETTGILSSLKKQPADKESTPCHTPFQLSLQDGLQNETVKGCRSTDEGALLGKLIKEVEFLMASPSEFEARRLRKP